MRCATIAGLLVLFGTMDVALAQERARDTHRRPPEHSVAAPREAMEESVTRLAMRGAFSTSVEKQRVARQDLLGLYLMLSAPQAQTGNRR